MSPSLQTRSDRPALQPAAPAMSVGRTLHRPIPPPGPSRPARKRPQRPFPTLLAVNRLARTDRRISCGRLPSGRCLLAARGPGLREPGGHGLAPARGPRAGLRRDRSLLRGRTFGPGFRTYGGTRCHARAHRGRARGRQPGSDPRAIRSAKRTGNTTLVIELDTPGGALDVMWAIQKQLLEGEKDGLTLVAWVHNHATSAGALVALTCKRIYMSSTARSARRRRSRRGAHGIEALPERRRAREDRLVPARRVPRRWPRSAGDRRRWPIAMVDRETGVRQVKVDGERAAHHRRRVGSMREAGTNVELVKTVAARAGELLNLTAQRSGRAAASRTASRTTSTRCSTSSACAGAAVAAPLERSNSRRASWRGSTRSTPLLLAGGPRARRTSSSRCPGFGLPGILSIVCFALLLAGQYLAGLADVPHIVAVALGVGADRGRGVRVARARCGSASRAAVLVVGGLVLGSLGPGFDIGEPARSGAASSTRRSRILVTALGRARDRRSCSRASCRETPLLTAPRARPARDAPRSRGAMPEAGAADAAVGARRRAGRAVTALRPVGKVVLDEDPRARVAKRAPTRRAASTRGARVRVVEVQRRRGSSSRPSTEAPAGSVTPEAPRDARDPVARRRPRPDRAELMFPSFGVLGVLAAAVL